MRLFERAALVFEDRVMDDAYLLEDGGAIVETGHMADWGASAASHALAASGASAEAFERVDCRGDYLCPGFIDLHVHGGGGHDFMDGTEEAFVGAARMHLAHGTTTLLPTTCSGADEALLQACEAFAAVARRGAALRPLPYMPGLHLESCYFNPAQAGAQDPRYLFPPTREHFERLVERAEGRIARVSAAPELEGALELGRALSERGVLMSIAHSDAGYEEVLAAARNGYTHLTHFYSGMSGLKRVLGRRVLGVIESGYLLDAFTVELIADGIHLPPELLRMVLKCMEPRRLCAVTDSMRAAGEPEGVSWLGGRQSGMEVVVEDGVAKLPDRSAYAGSVATADRLVRVLTRVAGLPLERAVAMVTCNPARIMGFKRNGALLPGYVADLVLLGRAAGGPGDCAGGVAEGSAEGGALPVKAVWREGRLVPRADETGRLA